MSHPTGPGPYAWTVQIDPRRCSTTVRRTTPVPGFGVSVTADQIGSESEIRQSAIV